MLAKRVPDGLRIYAMAAADDGAGGAPAAVKMAKAVKSPDTVTTDIPPTGGHAGPLWREHHPDDAGVVGFLQQGRERAGIIPDGGDRAGIRSLRLHRAGHKRHGTRCGPPHPTAS